MSVRFAREPLTDALWDDAKPLLEAHWKEIAHFTDIPLDPDRARYATLQYNGALACFTARDWRHETSIGDPSREVIDGRAVTVQRMSGSHSANLVGYALFIVAPNAHYQTSVQATQDVVYLDPSVRGGTGYKFIKWCDEQLAADGVQAVYHHVKHAHNFGALLERQGYELVDLIYTKRLDAPKSATDQVWVDGQMVTV